MEVMMDKKKRASKILLEKYDELKLIFKKYNVLEVRIFGSVAYKKDTSTSDVDFLVDLGDNPTLFQYGKLRTELEGQLKLPIDVLTYSGLDKKTLEHFKKNSILLDDLKDLTDETAIKNPITALDKVRMNLNSLIWVIDRINNQCVNLSKEDYYSNEIIQDSLARNVQLLGQIVAQIPMQEIEKSDGLDKVLLKGIITLRDALFMNVDNSLVWNTINYELEGLKSMIQIEIERIKK